MTEYIAVIEHDGSAWGAYCPDLPGLGVAAESRDDAERLIREAVELHVAELKAHDDPIPVPTTVGTTRVRVSTA